MDYDALGKQHEQLLANEKKKRPDDMTALSDWFGQVFGTTSKTTTNRKGKETTKTTPNAPTPTNLALAQGPTGYSDAMRANLGFAPAGTTPAPAPTTGMAALPSQPFWASPVASQAPTLEQVLGTYTPPAAPTAPTTTPPPSGNTGGGRNPLRDLLDRLGRGGGLFGGRTYNGGRDG